jgi:glycosyltransferase involved in cell wall biosynthesis
MHKYKVLICGHDLKFLSPFIAMLEKEESFEVRLMFHKGHIIDDEKLAQENLDWAEIIFCEWALGNAVWFSNNKKDHQILIVRLHAQEIRERDKIPYIWEINWTKVNRLILITEHLYLWMVNNFPAFSRKFCLIHNPIPAKTTFNSPKSIDTRFTLGLLGVVPALKRLDLAVELLDSLLKVNKEFKLFIKGSLPADFPWMKSRVSEMSWYDSIFEKIKSDPLLTAHIIFEKPSDDIHNWYDRIGHILSLSDSEGSHQAVAESMATGSIPAIRNWVGSDLIYPSRYICNNLLDLRDQIVKNSDEKLFQSESEFCREYSNNKFDEQRICQRMLNVIKQEISLEPGSLTFPVQNFEKNLSIMIIGYLPLNYKGGYRIRIEQEIQHLSSRGIAVYFCCLCPKAELIGPSVFNYKNFKSDFENLGCQFIRVPVSNFFDLNIDEALLGQELVGVFEYIKLKQIKMLHCEAIYCGRIGSYIKKAIPSLSLAIDWHGVAPEEAEMGGAHMNRINYLEALEAELLTISDLNIVVSRSMQNYFTKKYGISKHNYCVVPCCVNSLSLIEKLSSENVAKKNLVTFGYIGTLVEWQCADEMVRLFSKISKKTICNFKLLVPAVDHEKFFALANKYNLNLDICSIKEVPHQDVQKELLEIDVAILLRKEHPVNYVSSPTKFAEYFASGIPIIMTDCIGDYSSLAREYGVAHVIPASSLLTDEFNDSEIQSIINFSELVLLDKEGYAFKSKKLVVENLTWDVNIVDWINKFEELTS